MNPIPYGDDLSLNVNEYDSSISVELADNTAEQFGIPKDDVVQMTDEILAVIGTIGRRLLLIWYIQSAG